MQQSVVLPLLSASVFKRVWFNPTTNGLEFFLASREDPLHTPSSTPTFQLGGNKSKIISISPHTPTKKTLNILAGSWLEIGTKTK